MFRLTNDVRPYFGEVTSSIVGIECRFLFSYFDCFLYSSDKPVFFIFYYLAPHILPYGFLAAYALQSVPGFMIIIGPLSNWL